MAGVKGRSGGSRPNTGGARVGAGRKPNPISSKQPVPPKNISSITQVCATCCETKSISLFYKKSFGPAGSEQVCKACRTADSKTLTGSSTRLAGKIRSFAVSHGRDTLSDLYIISLIQDRLRYYGLTVPSDEVPVSLIEATRAHIKLTRFIKEQKHENIKRHQARHEQSV
jgi:hypothetical protein